ncbi:MAG TPA: hypothetical protein VIP98_12920 [Microlunatus sp.]
MSEASVLPPSSVLLHIGPYKTGTTAIQSALFAAKPRLSEYGVGYPGTWRRLVGAGYSVMRWAPRGRTVPGPEVWDRFSAHVRSRTQERICVSTEDFSGIGDPKKADKIINDLGGDRVHVLYVARALHRLLPSAWQERVKGHEERGYPDWLRSVLASPGAKKDAAYRAFWRPHDLAAKVRTWAPLVGPDRFHVLIADDSDRDYLLRRFEELLDLPNGFLEQAPTDNESLSLVRLELLRRLNERFRERQWSDRLYYQLVQSGLTKGLQSAPRSDVDLRPPQLPSWALERVRELGEQRINTITDNGLDVIGDLDRLRPPADYRTDDDHISIQSLVTLDTMLEGISALLDEVVERDDELRLATTRQLEKSRVAASNPLSRTSSRAMLSEVARRQRQRIRRSAARALPSRRRAERTTPGGMDRQREKTAELVERS